jgi:large subunit ribosomal protein L31e
MSDKDENIIEETVFNIPLSSGGTHTTKRRAPRALRTLRSFIEKHMKTEAIAFSTEVNEEIWRRGTEKPPHHVRERAAKAKDGKVTIYLVKREKDETSES